MQAKLITNKAPGGERSNLAERLPLSTPYVVQIFPIYACNFTCKYCHMSIPKQERKFVTDNAVMDFSLFEKCIDDMKNFPNKIKTLRFVGMGEPLLHPKIVEMVTLAKKSKVAERVEIITNGSLLSHEIADGLIEAGLDRMVISLQGTNAEKYKKVSNVELDFEKFIEGIAYFFEHKKNTHVYVKVVDIALENEEDKKKYFEIFGNISDSIGIENTVPIFAEVKFNETLREQGKMKTQFGLDVKKIKVCPQPFYTMQINPDGKVVGCHAIYYPRILDDCTNKSVVDVWNGEGFNSFRREMLDGREALGMCCVDCNINDFRMFPEDDISDSAEKIRKFY